MVRADALCVVGFELRVHARMTLLSNPPLEPSGLSCLPVANAPAPAAQRQRVIIDRE